MLEKEIGPTDSNKSFDERLMQIADIIIDHNKDELVRKAESAEVYFTYYAVTFIQQEELKNKVRDTFSASLSYLLLSRCGSNMRTWRKQRAFSHLDGFKKLPAISWAACTVTDFGKQVLLGIEKTVREYDQQYTKETQPTKNSVIVNMPQKETAEKQDHQEVQYPPVKIKRQKIDKVAETPVEKSYIRKKLDSCKQKIMENTDNETHKKKDIVL